MKKLFGVGINDADYATRVRKELPPINGKRRQETVWTCPYFQTWRNMLARTYSESVLKVRGTYKEVEVCEEWHTFSNFKAWMEQQDWEGKELDKDLLSTSGKIYSPMTCVFISPELNSFLSIKQSKKTDLPIGVHRYRNGKYVAQCNSGKDMKRFLGYFDTPDEAHAAWKEQKKLCAIKLIEQQTDRRVISALIKRFEI